MLNFVLSLVFFFNEILIKKLYLNELKTETHKPKKQKELS